MIWEKFFHTPFYAPKEDGDGGGGTETEVEEETSEETNEEESDEEETEDSEESTDDESDLSEKELKETKALYKLLKDPATAKVTIQALAENAGLSLSKVEAAIKDDKKSSSKKSVKDIITNSIGKQYPFLVDTLTEAFEQVLENEREASNTKIQELEQNQLQGVIDSAFEQLAKNTKGLSRKFEKEIISLSDKLRPAAGMSMYDYLENLYAVASSKSVKGDIKRELNSKIIKNSKDASGRLHSSTTSNGKQAEKAPKTFKEAAQQVAKRLGMT